MASGFTTAPGKVYGTQEAEAAARRACANDTDEQRQDYGSKSAKPGKKTQPIVPRSRSSYSK